jgi:hypothetical protein
MLITSLLFSGNDGKPNMQKDSDLAHGLFDIDTRQPCR